MAREPKIIEDKATPIKKEWEEYARKGNWTVKGYEMVRALSGSGLPEACREEDFMDVYRAPGVL